MASMLLTRRNGVSRSEEGRAARLFAEPSFLSRLRPANWLPSLHAARVLWNDYAHVRSVSANAAIDAEGRPLPWYTYPAISYLVALDFSDRAVFEFGSGMPTLFWAGRARQVVSVEDDEQWFSRVAACAPKNG